MLITQTAPIPTSPLNVSAQRPTRLVLDILGDSNAAGFSAGSENATGFRSVLQRLLREAGIWFRMVGLNGWGYTNSTGTTWGRFPAVDEFHDGYQVNIGDWRNSGFSGRRLSYTHTITAIDTGTDTISAAGHLLSNGSPVVITSSGTLPTVTGAISSMAGTIVGFATNVSAGVSYQIAAYQGGPALDFTAAGSGTITGAEGLGEMARAIVSTYDETPTDAILMGGTNDIAALIDAGTASPLAVLQTRAIAYFANYQLAAPNARKYVPSVLPFTSGITSFAAKQSLRNDYNAWLATYVPTLGRLWSYIDLADKVGAPQMTSDGTHPYSTGFVIWGEGIARAIIAGSGAAHADEVVPRPFIRRPAQACFELRATGDRINVPQQVIVNPAGLSGFVRIWHMPFSLATGTNAILQNENSYNNGMLVARNGDKILAYIRSAGAAITNTSYTTALKQYRWHHIFYFWDFTRQQVALYVNGNLVARTYSTWSAITASGGWFVGGNGLTSAPGLYQGFLVGVGASLSIEDSLRMAQRDYFLGEDPKGTTAKYLIDDGTGTAVTSENTGATSGTITVTTGGWVPAGQFEKPCDVGYTKPLFDGQIGNVTATYTATYWERVPCDPTSAGFTVNLPTAVGHDGERVLVLNNSASTNAITLDGNASETISGSTTQALTTAGGSMMIEAHRGNWYIV